MLKLSRESRESLKVDYGGKRWWRRNQLASAVTLQSSAHLREQLHPCGQELKDAPDRQQFALFWRSLALSHDCP